MSIAVTTIAFRPGSSGSSRAKAALRGASAPPPAGTCSPTTRSPTRNSTFAMPWSSVATPCSRRVGARTVGPSAGSKSVTVGSRFGSQRARRFSPVRRSASASRSRARACPASRRRTESKATWASGNLPCCISFSPSAIRESMSALSFFCWRRPSRSWRVRASSSIASPFAGSAAASLRGARAASYWPASKSAFPSAKALRSAARVVEARMRSSATRRPSRACAFCGSMARASSKATLASVARPSSSSRWPSARRCSSCRARAAESSVSARCARSRSCSRVTARRVSASRPRARTSASARRARASSQAPRRPSSWALSRSRDTSPRARRVRRAVSPACDSPRRRIRSAWSGVFLMAPCCSDWLNSSIAAECSCSPCRHTPR